MNEGLGCRTAYGLGWRRNSHCPCDWLESSIVPPCGDFMNSREFPTQRPVTRSFDVFFDLRLNKQLSKQSWGWWFERLSRPLWRQCNGYWRHGCVMTPHNILWDVNMYPSPKYVLAVHYHSCARVISSRSAWTVRPSYNIARYIQITHNRHHGPSLLTRINFNHIMEK